MPTPTLGTEPRSSGDAADITIVPPPPRSGSVRRVVARARVRQRPGLDPASLLTVYVVLLLCVPSRLVLPGLGAIGTPANIFALVALMWLCASWLLRRISPLPGTRIPRIAIGVLGLAVLLAYVGAARRPASGLEVNAADRGLIQIVAWIGVVYLASFVRDEERLRRLIRLMVVIASVAGAIAIAEFFMKRSLLGWIQIPGLQSNSAAAVVMDRGGFTRPVSSASHPLELATMMAMLLPFALHQAFTLTDRGKFRRWAPVGLISIAALVTVSRTAIIGLVVVGLILLPTWSPQRRWPTFGLIVIGLGGVQVLVPGLLRTIFQLFSAMFNGGDTSTQSRTSTYEEVFGYAKQTPWTGRGFGTYLPQLYRYTDNEYLLALVEMGIIGVLSILAIFVLFLHCGGAARRRFTDPDHRELAQSFVASAAVVLLCTATFDTLSFPQISGVVFLLFGMSGVYLGLARRNAAQSPAELTP